MSSEPRDAVALSSADLNFERPPESVFEEFRELHGLPAVSAEALAQTIREALGSCECAEPHFVNRCAACRAYDEAPAALDVLVRLVEDERAEGWRQAGIVADIATRADKRIAKLQRHAARERQRATHAERLVEERTKDAEEAESNYAAEHHLYRSARDAALTLRDELEQAVRDRDRLQEALGATICHVCSNRIGYSGGEGCSSCASARAAVAGSSTAGQA